MGNGAPGGPVLPRVEKEHKLDTDHVRTLFLPTVDKTASEVLTSREGVMNCFAPVSALVLKQAYKL